MAGEPRTLRVLVAAVADEAPDRPALLSADGTTTTYGELLAAVDGTAACLRAAGVARTEDVAVLAPNGVGMAMAFLGVASAAVCAPLNPVSTESELAFALDDLGPAAVLAHEDLAPRIRDLAEARGVPVLDLSVALGGAVSERSSEPPDVPGPDDVALVLHTSGTTARPKQVPLTHGNLTRSAGNVSATLRLGPADRCLNVMPLFHIHGLVAALCASLAAGASVVCTPGFDPRRFAPWTAEHRPSWYTAVPTIHQAVLAVEWPAPAGFRFVRSSSAALPTTVLADLEDRFGCPVIEAYGMTEAAHQMASNPLPPEARRPGTVGRATGLEIAIVDEHGTSLPSGGLGEIVIRGENVMAGYRDRAADVDAFVDGWFRTGDQGTLDDDGYLTIRSRLKELVNRGGEKIAPREVEEALLRHPTVGEALVFAVPHPTLGEDVGAAIVAAAGATPDPGALRRSLAADLAPFKVPRSILVVDALPRGATGKPQRVGAAERLGVVAAIPAAGPDDEVASALEVALAALWARVLGVERVGLHDDFFAAGGDSLAAAELAVQVLEVCRVALPVSAIFEEASTVAGMAELVRRTPIAGADADRDAEDDTGDAGPLSSAQERLWFLHAFEPSDIAYNEHLALSIGGPLDVDALSAALTMLEGRHEALRTSFRLDGTRPRAVVHGPGLALELVDLSQERQPTVAVRERATRLLRRPYDLAAGPPVCAHLLRASATDHLLLVGYHHIVADGRSRELLREELVHLYDQVAGGGTPAATGPAGRYADVARHERSRFGSPAFAQDLEHWLGVLGDPPAPLELPADHPRPAHQPTEVARFGAAGADDVREGLAKLAADEGATLFMVTLAGFLTLLHRHTGRTDIAIAVPVAGRGRVEWADVVGPFVNTVVIRVDVAGDPTFRDLVDRVRSATLAALDHQDVPFERLVQELHPERDTSHSPLVQVLFQLRSRPKTTARVRGLHLRDVRLPPAGAKFDLVADLEDNGRRVTTTLEYASELFDPETAEDLVGRYHELLAGAVAEPATPIGGLPLFTPQDRERLTSYRHGQALPIEPAGLHELVARRAVEDAAAVAVVDGGLTHTRGELDADSNRLASHLVSVGVAPGDRVGVCLDRSASAVVSLLAVLKCGATVVPLDPSYPGPRLHLMLDDADAAALLTTTLLAERLGRSGVVVRIDDHDEARLIAARPAAPVVVDGAGDGVATLIFTSGSTGRPKAVAGTHLGVVNRLAWAERVHPFGPDDRCAARAPISFVDSVAETFGPLVAGVPLVVVPDDVVRDPRLLVDLLRAEAVTRLLVVPSLLQGVLGAVPELGAQLPALRLVISSGEPLPVDLARRFLAAAPGRRLLNLYGSTEVAADATAHALDAPPGPGQWEVPIGRPIDNTETLIVDDAGREVPPGVVGELVIGGAGVACGYRGDPELTAQRFVGGRYRTGDLAAWDRAGDLRSRGRIDRQVKVRGMRLEPGEIEAAVAALDGVAEVAVTTAPGERGVRVVAHVVADTGHGVDPAAVRRTLREVLPAHLVPSSVVAHAAFPRTPSGKVDRDALAASSAGADGGRPDAAPLDPFEQRLATLWCELLEIEGPLGSEDEFFDLGGHSMLAVELSVAVEERFGRRLPLAQLFETPSLGELARMLRGEADVVVGDRAAVAVRVGAPDVRPLFWVPGLGGTVVSLYHLGRLLERGQPLYGLEAVGHREGEVPLARVEDLAATHLASVRALQPDGPYLLGGHSFGGLVAYEMACRLVEEGAEVARLIVVDSWPPDVGDRLRADGVVPEITAVPRARAAERRSATLTSVNEASKQALRRYRPRPFPGDLVLLATAARREAAGDPTLGWSALIGGQVEVREVAGEHAELVGRAGSDGVAAVVNELLRRPGARPAARRLVRRLRRRA